MTKVTIYMRLLDEDLEVYRPVQAIAMNEGVYKILDADYDPSAEQWEFIPGTLVCCKNKKTSDGDILLASELVS